MAASGFTGDLRFALRGLFRNRAFTTATVLTLALGIGANTAVFTLVDSVLIRPLPFRDSDRLVSIQHLGRDGKDELPMSPGLYLLYREQVRALESLGLYGSNTVNLVVQGQPERVATQVVTPGYFATLGVEPALGRGFEEAEGALGGEPAVILSDGFWRSRFGADRDILGKTVDINGRLRPVVGVMPPDFGFPDREAQLWLPMVIDPAQAPLAAFGSGGVG